MKKKSKKKFSLKNEYGQAFDFLKELRIWILVAFAAFIFFYLMGFLFFYTAPAEELDKVLDIVRKMVQELLEKTEGLGFFGMWKFIFLNNIWVGFLAIFLGFLFSIVPAFLIVSNGLVIGLISALAYSESGGSSFLYLLPHGIFEIPAIVISLAVGLRVGTFIFYRDRWERLRDYIGNAFRVFLLIVVPLLIIASFIEAWLIILLS